MFRNAKDVKPIFPIRPKSPIQPKRVNMPVRSAVTIPERVAEIKQRIEYLRNVKFK
jgi:hypothetical protein